MPVTLRSSRNIFCLTIVAVLSACGPAPSPSSKIQAVGAENFYADVISQIGGSHVDVRSVLSNPNTDPHTYESNTTDASAVGSADLIVQNGMGYDAFMQKLEAASPRAQRVVIDVATVFGRHAGENPHLWYLPDTMPKIAGLLAARFEKLDPTHAREYESNRARFVASLKPWTRAIESAKRSYSKTPVAVTEPVFNYVTTAMGLDVRTPLSFQLAVEEGNDPAPQDVATVRGLLSDRSVKAFIYNQQTVEPTTARLLDLARKNALPIVGVYETMPKGLHYQQWMKAEVDALTAALKSGKSTEQIH
ncbi:MAG: zinc ABC transporter substrate-binding protein [Candidatus Eremiobacteraeota bacterium]|nr:zinc ABC transporter substrate-binding protein [Candidatus Eremiobacteraeota bacterium]